MPTCDNSVENLHRLHPGQPLRLQHSPSLPNLCTAPYVKATSQSSRPRHYSRCSTPPPEKSFDFNIPTSPTTTPTTPTQNIKPLSHFGIITPSKIRTHPITPPRTPSASLNGETVSNGDSASDNDDTVIESGSEAGNEPVPPSRFLLIENIDRAVSTPALKESLFSSFTSIPRTSSIVGTRSDNSRKSNNNPIKGIYVRLVPSDGIVVLAFYDLRDAANAMMRIQNGDIVSMAGDRKEANVRREPSQDRQECQPERPELNCRFIMPRDLEKLIGHSTFVTETEGGFLVSSSDELSNTKAEDDGSGVNRKRVLAPESLKTMLGSFGPLCQFECTKKAVGDRKDVDVSTEPEVFWAEYFDVRNTAAARTALNGRTIFGVKLRLFARDGQHDVHDGGSHAFQHDAGPEDETIQVLGSIPFSHSPSTPTGTSYIPFPSSPVSQVYHALDEHHTTRDHVRVAGSQRVLFFDKAGRARPRSASAGHDSSSPTDLSSPTLIDPSSSPIILDSSFPFSLPALHSSPPSSPSVSSAPQTVEVHGRRCSNHLFFDATGKQTQGDSTRPRSLNVNIPVDDHAIRAADEQEAEQTPTSSFVYSNMNQHHTPYYYSTSPQESMPYYHSSYYHTPTPVPQSALQFPLPPSSPTSYGYNQEALNLNSWLWPPPPPPIPGMAALGTTSAYYQGVPPAPSPHMGGVYYPHLHPQYQQIPFPGEAQTTMSAPDPAAYLQTDQMSYQPHYAAFGLASPAQHTHQLPSAPLHEPPSAPSHPGLRTSAHLPSTGGPPSPPVVNHLNLTKIEEGLDTRTTVMVKNIPNKMSDKDLIAYIGNVCPKKIDFLYLRMDFQNGCNVGYAFVNFIRVEDLLTFAKSKLGVKWNMFSSEKVLQMSYANYQGKEALVEKFKNSCIMDEREAWRPKVFCSEPGINQGKPEPFPSPTHIRRKERSSLNRGALFVPGINAGGSHHLHNVPNRDQRTQPNDKEAAENNPSGQSYIGTQPPHSGTSTTFRSKKSSQQHLGRSPT